MNRLRYTNISTERDLRVAIVETGRICYNQGWMVSNDGNISARLGDNYIVITPAGVSKGRMDTEDPIVLDLDGNLAWSKPGSKYKPSTETPMHLEVYRQREDVRNQADAAQAQQIREVNIRQRRAEGGSRFNIRYKPVVPGEITPEAVMRALEQYVDFSSLDSPAVQDK